MKRLLLVWTLLALAVPPVSASELRGRVDFLTRRGQNPVVTETLVWLEPAASVPAPQAGRIRLTTRNKTLIPHVLAVPVGSTVEFPNEDPISHNLFSLTESHQFDLGFYRRGAGKTETFRRPGMINVYCNVHPGMSAVIHVMQTPWYTFLAQDGSFSFSGLPPGRYRIRAWNEMAGETAADLVIPKTGTLPAMTLTLDSRQYRQRQHLDKHGKPYSRSRSRDY